MNIKTALFDTPSRVLSKRRLLVGSVGLVALATLVLAHGFLLTTFIFGSSEGAKRLALIVLVWLLSAVALVLIVRGLKQVIAVWRAS